MSQSKQLPWKILGQDIGLVDNKCGWTKFRTYVKRIKKEKYIYDRNAWLAIVANGLKWISDEI